MSRVEVSTRIAAAAERVWAVIADPTRMGELSPECRRVTWLGNATAARVGARFKGSNRNGRRSWSTHCTITEYAPQQALSWDVHFAGLPVASWAYRIHAGAGDEHCDLVETFVDRRGRPYSRLLSLARGVTDVEAHNRGTMQRTLARIKAAAEGS